MFNRISFNQILFKNINYLLLSFSFKYFLNLDIIYGRDILVKNIHIAMPDNSKESCSPNWIHTYISVEPNQEFNHSTKPIMLIIH